MTTPQRHGAAPHIPDGKKVIPMQSHIRIALLVAHDQRARDIAQAASERRFAIERPPIRRFVGRRVIAVGQRIAAEPSLGLARSR